MKLTGNCSKETKMSLTGVKSRVTFIFMNWYLNLLLSILLSY